MFLLVKSNPTACSLHKCHTIADAAARLGENTSLIRVSFSSLAFFSKVIQLLSKPKNQYNLFTKNPFITKKNAQLFQDEVLSFLAHRTYLFPHPHFFRLYGWPPGGWNQPGLSNQRTVPYSMIVTKQWKFDLFNETPIQFPCGEKNMLKINH